MEEIFKLYQDLCGLFGEDDPETEFRQQIHCIIQEAIDKIPDEDRIAIRPAGRETELMLKQFDFSGKNIIGIVNRSSREDGFCGYPCFTADSFSTESCDCMIVCSFRNHQEIREELELLHIPFIDVYDLLEKHGIQLHDTYLCYDYTHEVVNYFYYRYLWSKANTQREIALNELLQIAVKYKDFALISNIYQDCGGENGEFPLVKIVWEKSKRLLDCIQNNLQERKQKDIVLFWTDAVPYNMLHFLPETMELSKQGTFFQRAYPNTPFTNSVLLAMFCNMVPIDDFPQNQVKIDSSNSPLIQFLENEGYKIRFVGDSKRAMGSEHLLAVKEEQTCNMKWWEGIVDLLQSPEPCFYIFHFMETHTPCLVPGVKEVTDQTKLTQAQWEVIFRKVCGYLDQCLCFYHKMLGNKTQVFLSDHGQGVLYGTRWEEQILHSYCFAVGKDIPKITVTRFFPYKNFGMFIQWLVDPVRFPLDDVCMDEMFFQDVDYYNPWIIDKCIKDDNAKYGIAYRGIINYEYKYVINALGEEFFYRMQQDVSEEPVPLEDPALRAELRDKAGSTFLDIYRYDKFFHTRKLYDFINQTKKDGNSNSQMKLINKVY